MDEVALLNAAIRRAGEKIGESAKERERPSALILQGRTEIIFAIGKILSSILNYHSDDWQENQDGSKLVITYSSDEKAFRARNEISHIKTAMIHALIERSDPSTWPRRCCDLAWEISKTKAKVALFEFDQNKIDQALEGATASKGRPDKDREKIKSMSFEDWWSAVRPVLQVVTEEESVTEAIGNTLENMAEWPAQSLRKDFRQEIEKIVGFIEVRHELVNGHSDQPPFTDQNVYGVTRINEDDDPGQSLYEDLMEFWLNDKDIEPKLSVEKDASEIALQDALKDVVEGSDLPRCCSDRYRMQEGKKLVCYGLLSILCHDLAHLGQLKVKYEMEDRIFEGERSGDLLQTPQTLRAIEQQAVAAVHWKLGA